MLKVKKNKYETVQIAVEFSLSKSTYSDYVNCEVNFVEVNNREDTDDQGNKRNYIRKGDLLFTLNYYTRPMNPEYESDKRSCLQPCPDNRIYKDTPYAQWDGCRVSMADSNVYHFEDVSKMIVSILKKINDSKETFNLNYRYPDKLQCLIETLKLLKVDQIVFSHNTDYYNEYKLQSYIDYTI
jgi:NAD-dependent dihydropyrimidine dehydrogenase PreA subunit